MTRKTLKFALLISLVAILALTASAVMASSGKKVELPEYLGSEACVGCHADKFVNWEGTGHAHMLSPIERPADYPGEVAKATDELKAELAKALYVVAGQRFVGRNPATGDLYYLNVQWNGKEYVAYKGGSVWNDNCAGCHATGYSKETRRFAEPDIGCEACHGPGRDHILGKGDISKISSTTDSAVCGQCHTGGTAPDGTRWPVGYRPGAKLSEYFKLPVVDPHAPGFPGSALHWRQYPLWQVSAHAQAVPDLEASGHANNNCYACHADLAFKDKVNGVKGFDAKTHKPFNSVTCVACHDPHNSANPGQLRMEPQALCTACHNGSIPAGETLKAGATAHHPMKEMLEGWGAIGIKPTKGAHSELECIQCHMTEGNHLFKIFTPEDAITLNDPARKDTCTACHTKSSAEGRGVYLSLWQESVGGRLAAIKADIDVVDAALKANPNALSAEVKAKYDAAKTNYTFVDADASKGAHNFEYAIKIVTAARKEIAAAKAALPK